MLALSTIVYASASIAVVMLDPCNRVLWLSAACLWWFVSGHIEGVRQEHERRRRAVQKAVSKLEREESAVLWSRSRN